MKRLKAFTILELLVSMLLSGIVISLILTFYLQFRKYLVTLEHNSGSDREIALFSNVLKRDFDRAAMIIPVDKEIIQCITSHQVIRYDFEDDRYILRLENNRTDTFNIRWTNLEWKKYSDRTNLINEFSFDIKIDKDLYFPVSEEKRYPAQVLFNYENKPYGN